MKYTQQIKFYFSQIYYQEKIKNKWGKDYLFDIESLIQTFSDEEMERTEIDVTKECKVRIEKFDYDKKNFLWRLRVLRLRDNNLGYIVKADEEAKPLELEDDEYLGQDMTMIFDIKNNIAMIQSNRYALGLKILSYL